jgi:hypothetical protein
MNWVSLLLQLLALRRGVHESHSMLETARLYAEKGKRAAAALVVALLAALFFFASLVVAVLEIGLQIDRHNGLAYSGLMVSATIFAGLGLALLLGAWLVGQPASPPPPPPPNPRAERIKDLLEEFLVNFLQGLSKPKGEAPRDR